MYVWIRIWFLCDHHRNSPYQVLGGENGEKILLRCINWVCKAYPACTEGDHWRWWTVPGSAAVPAAGNQSSWHRRGQWFLFLGAQIELEEQMLLSQALPWRHRIVLMASNINHGKEHEKQNTSPSKATREMSINVPTIMFCCTCSPPIKVLVTIDLPSNCSPEKCILPPMSSHTVKTVCGGYTTCFFTSWVLWWAKKFVTGHRDLLFLSFTAPRFPTGCAFHHESPFPLLSILAAVWLACSAHL